MAKHRKTEHYTPWQKVAWILVPTIAFGGLWFHKLGLLLIPIMATLIVLGFRKVSTGVANSAPMAASLISSLGPIPPRASHLDFFAPMVTGRFLCLLYIHVYSPTCA